jgi:hypothetical protein
MRKNENRICRFYKRGLIVLLGIGSLSLMLGGGHTTAHHSQMQSSTGKITKVELLGNPVKLEAKAEIVLDIVGQQLTGLTNETPVMLLNSAGMRAIEKATIEKIEIGAETHVRIKAEGVIPIEINTVGLNIPGNPVKTDQFRLTVEAVTAPPQTDKPKIVEIKFETLKSLRSPDEFSLFVTKEGGDGEFDKDADHMRVELMPPGASDIRIRPGSNNEQMVVDFRAPEKYEVKNVVVTIYNSGNLDDRNIKAIAKPFKDKPPQADPNQPVISDAEIMFVQRNHGYGRLKIEGRGFGDYPRAPFGSESSCCRRHREHITQQDSDSGPVDARVALELTKHANEVKQQTENSKDHDEQKRIQPVLKRMDELADELKTGWREWQRELQERVKIELAPRNPDLLVDRIEILYIDDKLIDVYFEFTRYKGYSLPFRLARATVSVRKSGVKQIQLAKTADLVATIKGPDTYLVAQDIGPKRDKNLQYRYSILDSDSAAALFGRGVANNFYVIQLSVINNGPKKVAVPLTAIQAEIEWAAMKINPKGHGKEAYPKPDRPALADESNDSEEIGTRLYFQGPPTLSPISLQSVSGYFDSHVKLRGKRALMFNTLSGIGQLATGLFPVFGPGFHTGVGIYSNAFIPALKTAVGDLSSQQLQNLTGLSWETVEVLPPSGGSANKYIYIQRGEQIFNLPQNRDGKGLSAQQHAILRDALPDGRKRIINILGLEVFGYELVDSEAKQATQP